LRRLLLRLWPWRLCLRALCRGLLPLCGLLLLRHRPFNTRLLLLWLLARYILLPVNRRLLLAWLVNLRALYGLCGRRYCSVKRFGTCITPVA
jgi:hypothetical protein